MENAPEEIKEEFNLAHVPFAAYELQAERHEAEKDKMRKHYRNIIWAISIPFILFITMLIGTIIYFVSNCNIASVYQDIESGDNGTAIIEDGIYYNTPNE